MSLALSVTPLGHPLLQESLDSTPAALSPQKSAALQTAFQLSPAAGFLHLASSALTAPLPPSLNFARDFTNSYLTQLCKIPELQSLTAFPEIPPPSREELAFLVLQAPPMQGLEYLNADTLAQWWQQLDQHIRQQIHAHPAGPLAYLRELNPLWQAVGHVTFHLAENKRDESHPFAFMATYATRLSAQGTLQHLPLARALQDHAGAKDRLLALLTPVHKASENCPWVKDLVESAAIYQPLAWTPKQAYLFLQDIPALEAAGIIIRVPNWWKSAAPTRVQVNVKIGDRKGSSVGKDALLDFSYAAALDGETLTKQELEAALASSSGLIRIRGQWVQVDGEKLAAALDHWKSVERQVKSGGVTFFEGMRLLAGTPLDNSAAPPLPPELKPWTGIQPGQWLEQTLAELRTPPTTPAAPKNFHATLRPYQNTGVHWLRFMHRLGLGACLADDMGLGKTIQILALLLHIQAQRRATSPALPPDLLVVPASLIGNWKSEIARFAPDLSYLVAHPSEQNLPLDDPEELPALLTPQDLVITTYGMLTRIAPLREFHWNLAILDEAQAIKNTGTRQTISVKKLLTKGRIALTGTPVENRLSDLWSLFDFLNPGLLGGAKDFSRLIKSMQSENHTSYAPLRTLVRPYILRRLKTDKTVIADLPEKTEVKAYCGLTREQVVLYEKAVRDLKEILENAEGIQRRGAVLASLMRFKQICNHPSQWLGDSAYDPAHSGKFARLAEICDELAQRQEKPLIFTQFREITDPLANQLAKIFGRPGLILHGGTPLKNRRQMVEDFAREDGPPFFVLSLKAGGTGLNLTAASHVLHFDRWWNPAVENQATDRAFRIGQKKNVMVHKFVCRGTVEERIDEMIEAKLGLSKDLLDTGAEKLLTEMPDNELLNFVALDIRKATEL